jgi:hypothetical protein
MAPHDIICCNMTSGKTSAKPCERCGAEAADIGRLTDGDDRHHQHGRDVGIMRSNVAPTGDKSIGFARAEPES